MYLAIVSIFNWKKNKEREELDELARCVQELIDDIDLSEISAQPYYDNQYIHGYNEIGLSNAAPIVLTPDISSCCSTLAWVAYILNGLGEDEAANKIDNIVTRLENKEKT